MSMPNGGDTFVFPAAIDPLSFISLNADNTVTITCQVMEMGQGSYTAAATLAGDELDADWDQLTVIGANNNPAAFGNPLFGGGQGTGGQTGTQGSYLKMRNAGAAMRAMIVGAAATRWGVDESTVSVSKGVVSESGQGRTLTFGDIAADAMAFPVPAVITLKNPKDFTFIGNRDVRRVDAAAKLRGETKFTMDLKLPGMLTAVIIHHQRPGQKVTSFDASKALAFPGVRDVFEISTGVAIVAENFWCGYEAKELVDIDWDLSEAFRGSTDSMYAEMQAAVESGTGDTAVDVGDYKTAKDGAATSLSRTTTVPYTAHAPFETLNIIAQLKDGQLDVWGGMQMMYMDIPQLAQYAGIDAENVHFHQQMTGGSFGRRATPHSIPGKEALDVIKHLKTDAPVKVMYSREDDMSSPYNYYRPGFVDKIDAGLDADGKLVAWKHVAAGESVAKGTMLEGFSIKNGIDDFSVEGGFDMPYVVPNRLYGLHTMDYPYRVSWLRSSGTFHNVFAVETMIHDLAVAGGFDPAQLRLDNLPPGSRERACLVEALSKADWERPMKSGPPGTRRGRGIALAPSHRSFSATVLEVTVADDESWYTVDRVVIAQDCGLAVNPDNIIAQMEGSVAFALTMARFGEITISDGKIDQVFYSDLHVTRMHTMPRRVECYIVDSAEGPSGASETIVCTIAPALANALANAQGGAARVRLPLVLANEPQQDWPVPSPMNTFLPAAERPDNH